MDIVVRRAIKAHFGTLSASEISERRVGQDTLFVFAKKNWLQHRKQNKNLTPAWWAEVQKQVEGAVSWRDLQATDPAAVLDPQLKAAIEQCQHKNPVQRRATKLDHFLRGCQRKLGQHEVVHMLNALAESYRRQCKFACDFGMAVAKYFAKQGMKTQFPDDVDRFLYKKGSTSLFC